MGKADRKRHRSRAGTGPHRYDPGISKDRLSDHSKKIAIPKDRSATKTFQAFRIKVNDELENLREILETGWTLLKKGGACA